MIGAVEPISRNDVDGDEARSYAAERLRGEPFVRPSVGELTARELELQRRLVRESLLLRPA
jgi:hypothetical protein